MRYGLFGQHTMLPNYALRVAGTVLVAVLALTACKLDEKDVRLEPPLVRVTTVVPAAQAERAFTGVISARVQSNLGFRVAGKIIERMVDTGEVVKVGQPLMRIDQTDLDLAITTKEKAVASARAVAVQAGADEARYAELRKAGWSTQQKYEQAKAALDTAMRNSLRLKLRRRLPQRKWLLPAACRRGWHRRQDACRTRTGRCGRPNGSETGASRSA